MSRRKLPIVGFIILALGGGIAVDRLYNGIQQNLQTQHEQIVSSCNRLNVVRASDNESHYADFKFDTLTTKVLAQSLRHPQRKLTHIERRQTKRLIASLRNSSNEKTWIPLTNCTIAVHTPTFKIPEAVHFTKQLPPPAELRKPRLLTP